ncbi:shikimate kinase [Virgibacillus xinjiangensis]|uniref:Shikimate kinase n=1 Tax=Virgibacillus xinjiangensis TaxID=393090 RepID=A0ABV7CYD1_9BACI
MKKETITQKSIVLIGFMGAGKTTVGMELAKQYGRPFIDTDEEIEKAFGMPATEIFQTHGERAFRKKEKEVITAYARQPGNIISVGGGAFLQEELKEVCMSNSIVIFLEISWPYWQDRLSVLIDTRPVLQGKSIKEIQELFEQRQQVYRSHHLKVNTDNLTPEQTAQHIFTELQQQEH